MGYFHQRVLSSKPQGAWAFVAFDAPEIPGPADQRHQGGVRECQATLKCQEAGFLPG